MYSENQHSNHGPEIINSHYPDKSLEHLQNERILPVLNGEHYAKTMQESSPMSEMMVSYFVYSMSGLKFPTNEQEKRDFLTSLALTGSISKVSPVTQEGSLPSPVSNIIHLSANEAHRNYISCLKQIENDRKAKIEEHQLNIDTIKANASEFSPDLFNQIGTDIKLELKSIGLPESQIEEAAFDIIKAISLELFTQIYEADESNKSKIILANELLSNGKKDEAIEIFHELIVSPEVDSKVEELKEKALNQWKSYYASQSAPDSDSFSHN